LNGTHITRLLLPISNLHFFIQSVISNNTCVLVCVAVPPFLV
jgi:hypothetical protein